MTAQERRSLHWSARVDLRCLDILLLSPFSGHNDQEVIKRRNSCFRSSLERRQCRRNSTLITQICPSCQQRHVSYEVMITILSSGWESDLFLYSKAVISTEIFDRNLHISPNTRHFYFELKVRLSCKETQKVLSVFWRVIRVKVRLTFRNYFHKFPYASLMLYKFSFITNRTIRTEMRLLWEILLLHTQQLLTSKNERRTGDEYLARKVIRQKKTSFYYSSSNISVIRGIYGITGVLLVSWPWPRHCFR